MAGQDLERLGAWKLIYCLARLVLRPLDEDDPEDETYLLAEHAEERAPGARTVTTTSPLGAALLGAAAGQEIVYAAPAGNFRYAVVGFVPYLG